MSPPSPAWLPRPAWTVTRLPVWSAGVPPSVAGSCTLKSYRYNDRGCCTFWSLPPDFCRPANKRRSFFVPSLSGFREQDRVSVQDGFYPIFSGTRLRSFRPRCTALWPWGSLQSFRPVMLPVFRPAGLHSLTASIATGLLPDHRTALAVSCRLLSQTASAWSGLHLMTAIFYSHKSG